MIDGLDKLIKKIGIGVVGGACEFYKSPGLPFDCSDLLHVAYKW